MGFAGPVEQGASARGQNKYGAVPVVAGGTTAGVSAVLARVQLSVVDVFGAGLVEAGVSALEQKIDA